MTKRRLSLAKQSLQCAPKTPIRLRRSAHRHLISLDPRQADQFQVVAAGRGMLGDHEFSDGAVHYTDAYSAYGPIVAGKSGIWSFTLRNRRETGARYMPAERETLHAAHDRHQRWELTIEAMPSALYG